MINRIQFKYKNLAKPAKASIWFVVCYVIQRGLQFIGMPIYTRLMSTDEYGVYSVFLSWFNLISVLSSLCIYGGTFNKAMVKYEDERDRYISSVQWLTTIVAVVVSCIILCFNEQITRATGYSIKCQLLMCVHILLFPSLQYWSQKQRFLYGYKKLVAVTLLNSIFTLGLGIVFVYFSSDKSFALIAITVIVQAVINGIIFLDLSYKGKVFFDKEFWSWSLITAVPLVPHYFAEIVLGHADRLMIKQICGDSQAGIYNIVYQISMVMTILRMGINGSFTPWLYYSLKEKHFEDIRNITKTITLLMASLTVLFMLIGPEILKLVAPPQYYEAVIGIPAIMIGCFFVFSYVLYLNVEIYFEKSTFVAISSVTSAIVNVVLNYYSIPKWGYISAAYTTMISYLLMLLMHFCFYRYVLKINKIERLYDDKYLFICSAVLICLGTIVIKVYDLMWIRWIIVISLLLLMILKRKKIIGMFTKLKEKR